MTASFRDGTRRVGGSAVVADDRVRRSSPAGSPSRCPTHARAAPGSRRRSADRLDSDPHREAETPTLLNRAPSMDGVVEEHPAHRPEPRSRLGKLAPRPADPGQGDGGGGEPDDHPDDQNPWRGRDDARNGDAQPEVPESKCPDGLLQCRLVRSPASSSTPNGLLGVVYGHVLPAADPDGDVGTRRTLCIISRPARGLGAASDESNDAQAR